MVGPVDPARAGGINPMDEVPQASTSGSTISPQQALQNWVNKFVVGYTYNSGFYCRVNFNNTGSGIDTNSEGMAYAMRLLASNPKMTFSISAGGSSPTQMSSQEIFTGLANYATSKYDSDGLMNWEINQQGAVVGKGSAADADCDMAYAFIQASKAWPGAMLGPYEFSRYATDLILNIYRHDTMIVDGKRMIAPGDNWGGAAEKNFDASYVDPTMWAAFGAFDPSMENTFEELTSNSLQVMLASQNITTGLIPDWCNPADPQQPGANFPNGHVYSYDSCRVPLRLAAYLENVSTTDPTAQMIIKILTPLMNTLVGDAAKNGMVNPAGYSMDGNPLAGGSDPSPAFDGPVAYALQVMLQKGLYPPKGGMSVAQAQSVEQKLWNNVNTYLATDPSPYNQDGSSAYYNSVIGLLSQMGY